MNGAASFVTPPKGERPVTALQAGPTHAQTQAPLHHIAQAHLGLGLGLGVGIAQDQDMLGRQGLIRMDRVLLMDTEHPVHIQLHLDIPSLQAHHRYKAHSRTPRLPMETRQHRPIPHSPHKDKPL